MRSGLSKLDLTRDLGVIGGSEIKAIEFSLSLS